MNKIKELRTKKGYSLRELARRAEIDAGNLSRIEKNEIKLENVTFGTVVRLCKALDIKLDELADIEHL